MQNTSKENLPKVRYSRFMLYALCFPLIAATPVTIKHASPPVNLIYQSTDGGETWHDISYALPVTEQPEDFFAGQSELYLRAATGMYRSKSNLKIPVWEKVKTLDQEIASIAFNHSGVMAYNYEGMIYQRISPETWLPRFTHFRKPAMRTIFETSDGAIFLGFDSGLYKSIDKGKNWKQVQDEGWVMKIVESEGVLVATGQKGIMRSIDKGEHWEWMISEGGVGIAIERINGGFAAISCNTTTMTRRIHISLDNGKTWQAISDQLRPTLHITSVQQVGNYLLCGHPDGIYRSSDLGKTWKMVHPSVEPINFIPSLNQVNDHKKVFKIFVSGTILYAVARNAGC